MLLLTAKPAFLLRIPWSGSLSPGTAVFVHDLIRKASISRAEADKGLSTATRTLNISMTSMLFELEMILQFF